MTAALDVEKLRDGLYILHDNDAHFIAARCIDGAWEVNLQNRRHTWQDAELCSRPGQCAAWCFAGRRWQLNFLQLTAFRISSSAPASECELDMSGGSSPASTIFPRLPSFIDSEFSDTPPSSPASSHASIAGLSPTALRCRINVLEWLLCDYKMLLAHQPSLFDSVPSPFTSCANRKWYAEVSERRAAMSLLCLQSGQACWAVSDKNAARVSKRMCVYISFLQNFMMLIQQDPQIYHALPNPCDAAISKRVWETAMFNHRKKLRAAWASADSDIGSVLLCHLDSIAAFCGQSMFLLWSLSSSFRKAKLDAQGGSSANETLIQVKSALSSSTLFDLRVSDDVILSHAVRTAVSNQYATPWFATAILFDDSLLAQQTWLDLLRPSQIFIVVKPVTFQFAGALFEAISANALEEVQGLLEEGQCPNFIVSDLGTPLTWAIENSTLAMVELLLQGNADMAATVEHGFTALHAASLHGRLDCLALLLDWQANPNTETAGSGAPAQWALSEGNTDIVKALLVARADPLRQDRLWGESIFTSSSHSNDITRVCMDQCWPRLTMECLLVRHLDVIVDYHCSPNLFCASATLQKQGFLYSCPDRLGAGRPEGLDTRQVVDHNKLVAKRVRDLRQIGKYIAPVTSQAAVLGCSSLWDLSLQKLLPLHMQQAYMQRSIMPPKPARWPAASPEVVDHLCFLNAHPRDCHLAFDAGKHIYFWDGVMVSISTTGLVHRFAQVFDAREAIAKMRSGFHWPRPGYLKQCIPFSAMRALEELGYAQELLDLLRAEPRPDEQICCLIRSLVHKHPSDKGALEAVAQTDDEIKSQWCQNGEIGASQGTWMRIHPLSVCSTVALSRRVM